MLVQDGTVDHFRSWAATRKTEPELAYEWSNYRYASGIMNACKSGREGQVLDPFIVQDGWFEVLLPSLQLVATAAVAEEYRALADSTLRCLRLRDDEAVIEYRRGWYQAYLSGGLTLDQLRLWAPLIARAVEKQQAAQAG